ncbi:universal stress protein [Salinibacter altiplanensis]|uniref:universal stress protein n=1 Tax=Salinibacter altiplanensis TaxID=1803181 RepID=UPI000C9F560B|nr:universal stress protein [Salinibacter altiplanensis]
MLVIDRILVPHDFTPASVRVLPHGLALAARMEARFYVLHVADRSDAPYPARALPAVRERLQQAGVVSEEALRAVPIEGVSRKDGGVAETIHRFAREEEIDLIALGTRGRQGARRFLTGSVAETVIRRAERPVLALRGEGAGAPPVPGTLDRILVPVDFSEDAREAGRVAAEWARFFDAQVDLLHVVTGGSASLSDQASSVSDEEHGGPEKTARRALAAMGRGLGALGVPVAVHVRTGAAAPRITEFVEAEETDAIVMSTQGRAGLERFLLGSVTEAVIRHVPCPVLTVRSYGRSIRALAD